MFECVDDENGMDYNIILQAVYCCGAAKESFFQAIRTLSARLQEWAINFV